MNRRCLGPLALAATCLCPSLFAQDAAQRTVERPAYTFLRFNEDWSVLRNGSPTGGSDLWDPIKSVPLGESGDVWMSFGGYFNQLYPLGHAYLGFADLVGRQNILAPSVGLLVRPRAGTTLAVRGFRFWRQRDQDAVYNVGGGVFRAGNLGTSKAIASEIDVWLSHKLGRHTTGLAGYSHVFPGDFMRESGSAKDIDFFYVQLRYTF